MLYTTYLIKLPLLFYGLGVTLLLLAASLLTGAAIAALLLLLSLWRKNWLTATLDLFVGLIQGTPLLAQLFFLYYGLGGWLAQLGFVGALLFKKPLFCAIISLGINSSAYVYSLVSKAIKTIDRGYLEAAKSLGLSAGKMARFIQFPLALPTILTAYTDELTFLVKGTTLASTIAIMDFMATTHSLVLTSYQTLPYWLLASLVYLTLQLVITAAMQLVKKYLTSPKKGSSL